MDINNRVFLVSGGASGLGEATVRRLVADGARVAIVDRNIEAGEGLARELGEATRFFEADVTAEAPLTAALAGCRRELGGLHGAVNCAGIVVVARVLGKDGTPHDLESFSRGIRVNLIGSFNVIRLVAAELIHNTPDASGERGVIVNTASIAAFDGQIGQASYAASKGGVVGMTLPIARELAAHGIRVMTVAPGIFDTPMMAGLPDAARESLGRQVPFPSRLGDPAEYAALVAHIVGNPMLNGEVIRLDGAIRMAPR